MEGVEGLEGAEELPLMSKEEDANRVIDKALALRRRIEGGESL